MSTTPLWVPIVVAGIGVAGTLTAGIAGGLITQRWADRRDDKTWQRERLREQERWLREDEGRTFEHRREAFEECYQAVKALVLQQYFVICGLSSLVVAGPGAVLVVPAPAGPGPCGGSAGGCGGQVCQETADLAERDRDEDAARACGAVAAVTAR